MARQIRGTPAVIQPERPSAVGSRNSLNRDTRDEYAVSNSRIDEEIERQLNTLETRLPKASPDLAGTDRVLTGEQREALLLLLGDPAVVDTFLRMSLGNRIVLPHNPFERPVQWGIDESPSDEELDEIAALRVLDDAGFVGDVVAEPTGRCRIEPSAKVDAVRDELIQIVSGMMQQPHPGASESPGSSPSPTAGFRRKLKVAREALESRFQRSLPQAAEFAER